MFEPEYPIRTERLLLRPWARGDVDGLYAYHRLPEVHRYLYSEARSRAEVEALVAERAGPAGLTEAGQELHLVAALADTGELVGDCVFFALLRLGFEGLALHRITGHLDARNIASARVLERAGMRREAHLVENEFVKGEWSDELVYAMLRSEWEARQARG